MGSLLHMGAVYMLHSVLHISVFVSHVPCETLAHCFDKASSLLIVLHIELLFEVVWDSVSISCYAFGKQQCLSTRS